jgi:hypothetical protein
MAGSLMRTLIHAAVAVVVAVGLAACGITSPSDLKTEPPFTGTIHPGDTIGSGNGLPTLPFTQSKTGEFIVKITAMAPDTGATIGVLYGAPSAGLCGAENANSASQLGHTVFDQTLPGGDYCLQVFDSGGGLTRPETFTISVQHS